MQWASVRHEDSAIGNARCIDGEGLSAPPRRAPRRAPERTPTHSSSWSESDSRFGWCDLVRTNQHVKTKVKNMSLCSTVSVSSTKKSMQSHLQMFDFINNKNAFKAIFKCLLFSTKKKSARPSSNVCFSQQKTMLKAIFKCLLFSTIDDWSGVGRSCMQWASVPDDPVSASSIVEERRNPSPRLRHGITTCARMHHAHLSRTLRMFEQRPTNQHCFHDSCLINIQFIGTLSDNLSFQIFLL